jgi:next-to-BRCA1 protein 1
MFVIKATLKDETRRLSFEGHKFPSYGEVQTKVSSGGRRASTADPQLRTLFNLPSTTHTFWVNALLYPDDAQDARIMFKRHVCDAHE